MLRFDDPMTVSKITGFNDKDALNMTEIGTAGAGRKWFSTALNKEAKCEAMIIISAGIHRESNLCLKTVSAYNLSTNSVLDLPSINEARYLHTSCIVGKSLFVIGGLSERGEPVNYMEALDLIHLKEMWHSG